MSSEMLQNKIHSDDRKIELQQEYVNFCFTL